MKLVFLSPYWSEWARLCTRDDVILSPGISLPIYSPHSKYSFVKHFNIFPNGETLERLVERLLLQYFNVRFVGERVPHVRVFFIYLVFFLPVRCTEGLFCAGRLVCDKRR